MENFQVGFGVGDCVSVGDVYIDGQLVISFPLLAEQAECRSTIG